MKVKVKSCPNLCDPMDCSLPGSSIRGIFQARVLEGVATWELKVSKDINAFLNISKSSHLFILTNVVTWLDQPKNAVSIRTQVA